MTKVDSLTPFLLEGEPIRGRLVRLNESVNKILSQHDYPHRISELLAETLTMAAILSVNLKSDGVFTIQIQSKGALQLLVVDARSNGYLRGYAQFDAATLDESAALSELCKEGYLAITLDPGEGAQRYQGVVPLEGESIADTMQHYFTQSQQLMVTTKLAVRNENGVWSAGGIYIEHMPESAEASAETEAWREAQILLHTVTDSELLDNTLPAPDLLFRLYHEKGVRIFDDTFFEANCRCTRDKVFNVLKDMEAETLSELATNGSIVVDCQFCGHKEIFALDELTVASS